MENAADLLARIRARTRGGVRVDLSAVTVADTAGLQLLAVVKRHLQAAGRVCELTDVPAVVADGAALLGLGPILDLG